MGNLLKFRALPLLSIATLVAVVAACENDKAANEVTDTALGDASRGSGTGSGSGSGTGSGGGGGGIDPGDASPGRATWGTKVQPLLASACASCHLGKRFGFASLARAGAAFTPAETEANYQKHLDMISLDAPEKSRILEKMLSDADPEGMVHAGGAVAKRTDDVYKVVLDWIRQEQGARCPSCGLAAQAAKVAYVEAPEIHWALPDDPFRADHGLRGRSRIMVRNVDPKTSVPTGDPIEFLPASFCGADGHCDFRGLTVSNAGDRMAFDCRLSLTPADWVNDVRWNVCIAEIGPDGRAQNPRFLMTPDRRHSGSTIVRSDPFGRIKQANGLPLKGVYDQHFMTRRRRDGSPVFSPDGTRVYLASMGPDPRTHAEAMESYHGSEHLAHIVTVKVDGSDLRTTYLNEGGVADLPFFLRNGNIAFHTWNLERMDRHMYTQSTADGMGELPVLLGKVQGPNMWGRAVQLGNGAVLGMTGRRRSSIDNYVPFLADHTLGTGNDPDMKSLTILDPVVFEQVIDFPTGYCVAPPDGPSCVIDQYYADPSYLPDGRALLSHNPEKTYVLHGEDMFLNYSSGDDSQRVESMRPFVPKRLGISAIDAHGKIERLMEPAPGTAISSPVWIGKRWAQRKQPWKTDETKTTTDLHIASVPAWFSFGLDPSAQNKNTPVASIVALRVLVKELDNNACINDDRPYRYATNAMAYDHPTHLGMNNATGFSKLPVPATSGGNAFGDVPLQADGSVFVRVPAGKLLMFQGIDANGHAIVQRSRLQALPPGQRVDTSVRASQYNAHCMSCHGALDHSTAFVGLKQTDKIPFVPMDFDTLAAKLPPADASTIKPKRLTFLDTMRPLLDQHCISCHAGTSPAGELSLEAHYSTQGNFPMGKWATTPGLASADYMASVPVEKRVPSYTYSMTYSWDFREDETEYKQNPAFSGLIGSFAPLGDLAPWDPAYQNLYANDGARFIYLSGYYNANFGRGDRLGGLAFDSWLVEILTGRDIDPVRTFHGPDHTHFLSEAEVRDVIGTIDVGFPFMATCDAKTIPSGPNSGAPWGQPRL